MRFSALIYILITAAIIWRSTQVGRRGAPAKGVGRETGARVQISPSPPKGNLFRLPFYFELERRERDLPRSSCGRCARRCSKAPLSLLRINISSFCPPKFLLSVYHIIGKKSIKQNLFPLIFLPIAAVLISPQHLPT